MKAAHLSVCRLFCLSLDTRIKGPAVVWWRLVLQGFPSGTGSSRQMKKKAYRPARGTKIMICKGNWRLVDRQNVLSRWLLHTQSLRFLANVTMDQYQKGLSNDNKWVKCLEIQDGERIIILRFQRRQENEFFKLQAENFGSVFRGNYIYFFC